MATNQGGLNYEKMRQMQRTNKQTDKDSKRISQLVPRVHKTNRQTLYKKARPL